MIPERRGLVLGRDVTGSYEGRALPMLTAVIIVMTCLQQRLGGLWHAGELFIDSIHSRRLFALREMALAAVYNCLYITEPSCDGPLCILSICRYLFKSRLKSEHCQ